MSLIAVSENLRVYTAYNNEPFFVLRIEDVIGLYGIILVGSLCLPDVLMRKVSIGVYLLHKAGGFLESIIQTTLLSEHSS